MFWFFKRNNTEKRLKEINSNLISSFSKVKKDISNMHQWLDYLYKKDIAIENSIKSLENKINTSNPGVKLKDIYSSFNEIQNQVFLLKSKMDATPASNLILNNIDLITSKINSLSIRLDKIESKNIPDKKTNLKHAILKDINKKSKGYIKNLVYSLIKKYGRISAPQLKKIVVDEQLLCSKSTFYRILSELEHSDLIGVISTKKEKQFLFKLTNQT